MKSILISIQPQWVEKILNGEKTIEIRKTIPKCELPCNVYIYCTKPKKWWAFSNWGATSDELVWKIKDKVKMCNGLEVWDDDCEKLNGKVVAEFILKQVEIIPTVKEKRNGASYQYHIISKDILNKSCLKQEEILEYTNGKDLYAWHIDNLKIYDKPKELSEFSGFIPSNKCEKHENGFVCDKCDAYDKEHETCLALYYCRKPIKRPPQSWCYVEELED